MVARRAGAAPMISSFNIMMARMKGQPDRYYVLTEGSVVVQRWPASCAMHRIPMPRSFWSRCDDSPQAEGTLSEGGFWPAHPDAPPVTTLPRLADLHPVSSPPPSPDAANIQAFLKKFKTVFGRHVGAVNDKCLRYRT